MVYNYWEPIKGFFSRLWEGVKGIFSGALEGIKTVLGWTPLGLITSNWGGITDFIGGLWDNVTAMTQKALDWVSSKLEWVGNAAKKVAGFFGFGDDEEQTEGADKTARSPGGRSQPGEVVARGPAASPASPARPQMQTASQSTTNNQTNNQRGGDTFQISIVQQPGEDAETLAQRVARIIQQQRRQENAGALYDQPAGA